MHVLYDCSFCLYWERVVTVGELTSDNTLAPRSDYSAFITFVIMTGGIWMAIPHNCGSKVTLPAPGPPSHLLAEAGSVHPCMYIFFHEY